RGEPPMPSPGTKWSDRRPSYAPAWRDPRWRSYSGAGSASAWTSVTSSSAACDPPASRLGADASHAWASVLGPQAGSGGGDPTNDPFADDPLPPLTHS